MTPLHQRLRLDRPLVFFDLETTGRFPERDRIVEITIVKLYPDGTQKPFTSLVNPTIPIPADATAIHSITDAMVRGAMTFKQLAPTLVKGFEDADLAGYNIRRFDVPLLVAEFKRAGVPFSVDGRKQIDPCAIFHKREARDLAAALQFYCGRALDGAHRAGADVDATIAVLAGQFDRYPDLPATVDDLHAYCKDPSWVDEAGRVVWISGVACLSFGKHAGETLENLAARPDGRDYLKWICTSDFGADTRAIVKRALDGKFPTPEPATQAV